MIANQLPRRTIPTLLLLCVIGLLDFHAAPAGAQNVGDWRTAPGLQGLAWDNSTNNTAGNSNSWQTWNGSAWVTQSGTTAGASFPENNSSGRITILSNTTVSNSIASLTGFSSASGSQVDGIVVQSNASLVLYKSDFTLNNYSYTNVDLDIFGSLTLNDGSAGGFVMNPGATIVVEPGAAITNMGATSGDVFTGSGYFNPPSSYISGAITFKSNSVYVLAAITNKGTISYGTWLPGSTCLIAPPSSNHTNFIPSGLAGQTFYNLIWNWPTSVGKNGGSGEGGSFTVNGNFYMSANPSGLVTNEDFPYSGNTMTVWGNIGLTNVAWFPTASSGTVTLYSGGNFSVDSTATIKNNSASALGNVIFDGTNGPQTLGFYGPNSLGGAGGWNWTVNSGSTVNLNSAMTINGGTVNTGGALNISGTFALTANGSLSGTSNIITVAQGGTFNVSQGTFTFAAEDTLQGAGTVVGPVTAGSSSVIHPGLGLPLTFSGNLTYGSTTSTNILNLTSTPGSGNDQIVVSSGNVVANGAQMVINSAGTLSTTTDYVLLNVTGSGSISGSFNSTPAWAGATPANSSTYSIVTTSKQVLLHYGVIVPQPSLTSAALSGTANLLISGANGIAGQYVVLSSTNLNSTHWTPVSTNTLTGSGTFSITVTNALVPGVPQKFFILKAP